MASIVRKQRNEDHCSGFSFLFILGPGL
ncbi:rCG25138 [Rattus norvegicus]|uniref:RCG25138 n=1 Tax=Rattus norvegicus TaxID=10116 RepID=A6I436_RAT|nr:rCG25138 [Rattus norvegicus]